MPYLIGLDSFGISLIRLERNFNLHQILLWKRYKSPATSTNNRSAHKSSLELSSVLDKLGDVWTSNISQLPQLIKRHNKLSRWEKMKEIQFRHLGYLRSPLDYCWFIGDELEHFVEIFLCDMGYSERRIKIRYLWDVILEFGKCWWNNLPLCCVWRYKFEL